MVQRIQKKVAAAAAAPKRRENEHTLIRLHKKELYIVNIRQLASEMEETKNEHARNKKKLSRTRSSPNDWGIIL